MIFYVRKKRRVMILDEDSNKLVYRKFLANLFDYPH